MLSGDALKKIGPIIATEVVCSGDSSWIVCGGRGGLAVLCAPGGRGVSGGIGPSFAGLTPDMAFKNIGDYRWVSKLVCDDGMLYVMSDSFLDRIDLAASDFGAGRLATTRLIDTERRDGVLAGSILFDCVISSKLALVGTGLGLYRSSNNQDVRTMHENSANAWQQVSLPGERLPVPQLIAHSYTGRSQDVARGCGGTLYVLVAFQGYGYAALSRLSISPVDENGVTNTTVQGVPDLFFKDNPASFMRFGGYRNHVAVDGARFFSVHNKDVRYKTFMTLPRISYEREPRTGNRFSGEVRHNVPLDISPDAMINAVVQDCVSGCWLVAGDFGVRANE